MRVAIEDLEALKELNDELEENHVEAERQLNAEIGQLLDNGESHVALMPSDKFSMQLRDERKRSGELEHLIADMEATLGNFRELVAGLQASV